MNKFYIFPKFKDYRKAAFSCLAVLFSFALILTPTATYAETEFSELFNVLRTNNAAVPFGEAEVLPEPTESPNPGILEAIQENLPTTPVADEFEMFELIEASHAIEIPIFQSPATVKRWGSGSAVGLEVIDENTFKVEFNTHTFTETAGASIVFDEAIDIHTLNNYIKFVGDQAHMTNELIFEIKGDLNCIPGEACLRIELETNRFDGFTREWSPQLLRTFTTEIDVISKDEYTEVRIPISVFEYSNNGPDYAEDVKACLENIKRINFIADTDYYEGEDFNRNGSFQVKIMGLNEIIEAPMKPGDPLRYGSETPLPRLTDGNRVSISPFKSTDHIDKNGNYVHSNLELTYDDARPEDTIHLIYDGGAEKADGSPYPDRDIYVGHAGVITNFARPFADAEDQKNRDTNKNGVVDVNELDPDRDVINFHEAFPEGLFVGQEVNADFDDEDYADFKIEVKDILGIVESMSLERLHGSPCSEIVDGMSYFGLLARYFSDNSDINLSAIQSIALVFSGRGHSELDIRIPGYDVVFEIESDDTLTSDDITEMPPITDDSGWSQEYPFINTFGSQEPNVDQSTGYRVINPETSLPEMEFTAQTTITPITDTSFQLSYNGLGQYAYGGLYMLYDYDLSTTETNPFSFSDNFTDGLVIGLSAPDEDGDGAADTDSILFELTDNDDKGGIRSKVKLTGLTTETQFYRIPADFFDSAMNLDQIKKMAFIFSGEGTKKVDIEWGGYALQ